MRLHPLPVLLPVFLVACNLLDVNAPNFRERAFAEITRQENLWKGLAIHDYDLDFKKDCEGILCDPIGVQPVRVHVRNSVVNRVVDGQGADVQPAAGVSWPTVDSLFLWSRQFLDDQSLVVEVQFDTTQHFPVLVRGEDPGRVRVVHNVGNFVVQPAGTPLVAARRP